jgi:hypothetical protein
MIADVIYTTKTIKQTAFTKEERDYKTAFESELKIIKDKPPVDAKMSLPEKKCNSTHTIVLVSLKRLCKI